MYQYVLKCRNSEYCKNILQIYHFSFHLNPIIQSSSEFKEIVHIDTFEVKIVKSYDIYHALATQHTSFHRFISLSLLWYSKNQNKHRSSKVKFTFHLPIKNTWVEYHLLTKIPSTCACSSCFSPKIISEIFFLWNK